MLLSLLACSKNTNLLAVKVMSLLLVVKSVPEKVFAVVALFVVMAPIRTLDDGLLTPKYIPADV